MLCSTGVCEDPDPLGPKRGFQPAMVCVWSLMLTGTGTFGSQGEAAAAHVRSDPCHQEHTPTWHSPGARTLFQPRELLCSFSCNESPSWSKGLNKVGLPVAPRGFIMLWLEQKQSHPDS